ncbi:MAG: nitrous oxide reductase accessory protein NosL [Lysinibacillus sp.]
MKKIILVAPLLLGLYACNDEVEDQKDSAPTEEVQVETAEKQNEKASLAKDADWTVDERLQEPTEDTICLMCDMKVYTKDHEQGVFSAQAIREDGKVVFYDDIGCLLNDEYVNEVQNDKFVRDYATLNWFNVDDAIVVKTDLKSPMNWGYIFFKYQEDADAYMKEHPEAAITPLEQIRNEAIERYKKKKANEEGNSSETQHE